MSDKSLVILPLHITNPDIVSAIEYISQCYVLGLKEENQSSPNSSWRGFSNQAEDHIKKYFSQILSYTGMEQLVLLAQLNGVYVGYVYVIIKRCEGEVPDRVGSINGLYVNTEYRGRGIAQKLYDAAMKFLKEKSINYSEITVNTGNIAARSFWQKNGFEVVEQVMGKRH